MSIGVQLSKDTHLNNRSLVWCIIDGRRQLAKSEAQKTPPPKIKATDPSPTEEQVRIFHHQARTLDAFWTQFQQNYLKIPKPQHDGLLVSFCFDLIEYYDQLQGESRLKDIVERTLAQRGIPHQNLAKFVNREIPIEIQEQFWNTSLDKERQNQILAEQRYKYGTREFTHAYMPRIITEKTREEYIARINARKDDFERAGFKFLGLGFGGAAFLVKASDRTDPSCQAHGTNIPKYVLKVPAVGPYAKQNGVKVFSPLEEELKELGKLTNFSYNYEEETGRQDNFSQRLACYRNPKLKRPDQYLVPQGFRNRVLATVYQEGQNIYQTAVNDNNRRELGRRLAAQSGETLSAQPTITDFDNPYVVLGVPDTKIIEIIHYYMKMAEKGINFYDLFPHNIHYLPAGQSLSFVDTCSGHGEIQRNIIAARKAFPLDMCIFDLLTFIIMQEQNHPIPAAIRRNTQEMIVSAIAGAETSVNPESSMLRDTRANKALIRDIYRDLREERYVQIRNALDAITSSNLQKLPGARPRFSLDDLCQALKRLMSDDYSRAYTDPKTGIDHYTRAMKKDFDRLMVDEPDKLLLELYPNDPTNTRGKGYIRRLHEHFAEKQKQLALQKSVNSN